MITSVTSWKKVFASLGTVIACSSPPSVGCRSSFREGHRVAQSDILQRDLAKFSVSWCQTSDDSSVALFSDWLRSVPSHQYKLPAKLSYASEEVWRSNASILSCFVRIYHRLNRTGTGSCALAHRSSSTRIDSQRSIPLSYRHLYLWTRAVFYKYIC